MLAVEERTLVLPVLARHRPRETRPEGDAPDEDPRPLRPGTAIYRCFRYERYTDPAPTYVDGRAPDALPAQARIWRLTPWNRYERAAEFDAPAAALWVEGQLLQAVGGQDRTDPARNRWAEAIVAECARSLDTLDGAYQTRVDLRDGNMIALAVVATWQGDALHPKLAAGGWY
ncbi:hypothetical protein [Glycomyces sp. NPDC047010]|uniref:hypothetical protein n=1 Tax=Glycomyces sp. NPDC047010 TaxID=3155023 RepID=UPI00340917F4